MRKPKCARLSDEIYAVLHPRDGVRLPPPPETVERWLDMARALEDEILRLRKALGAARGDDQTEEVTTVPHPWRRCIECSHYMRNSLAKAKGFNPPMPYGWCAKLGIKTHYNSKQCDHAE